MQWIKKHQSYLYIAAAVLIVIFYCFWSSWNSGSQAWLEEDTKDAVNNISQNEDVNNDEKEAADQEEGAVSTIIVDIKGAVIKPGVYETKHGTRVIEVIKMAGGMLETADEKRVNFAKKVEDEEVIYIPEIGEEITDPAAAISPGKEDTAVNINKADEQELQTLTGIGPSKAAAIIEYRETNGPFKTVEALQEVSGIGGKTFEKIKEEITVH
ncbi:helix-hairpin-helix domain-containing protein [Bacillaceae bacterium Marseille-Q3522]|nr:helix-hairpin-helix domain-containing protein [Bacillaceae bacterium Marseille-Q3522]